MQIICAAKTHDIPPFLFVFAEILEKYCSKERGKIT